MPRLPLANDAVPPGMPRLDVALAAGTTVVAAAFTLFVFDRWLRRRRLQDQAWSVAMALFTVACGALWYGFGRGWSRYSFRVFYLFGGILNVPWLALGTVILVAGTAVGRTMRTWLVLLSGVATGVVISAPMKSAVPPSDLPAGRELFGALPRIFAAVGSGVAALIIIVGALWSAARLRRRRSVPGAGASVLGNVLIAVGTLVLSSAGSLNARLGESRAFAVTTLAGVVVLFAGVLVTAWRRRVQPPQGPQPPAL